MPVCTAPLRQPARMATVDTTESSSTATAVAPPEEKIVTVSQPSPTWPPVEMTTEWAEAVSRLENSVPSATLETADIALDEADGDEMAALRLLMDESWSDIRRQREMAVAVARANGDVNRVSAVKEAELRRKATGSSRDFFKGYIELKGSYIDAGYIDDSADAMGKISGAFKSLFGGKKKE